MYLLFETSPGWRGVFLNSILWGPLSSNVFTICAVYWSLGRRGYFGVSNVVLVCVCNSVLHAFMWSLYPYPSGLLYWQIIPNVSYSWKYVIHNYVHLYPVRKYKPSVKNWHNLKVFGWNIPLSNHNKPYEICIFWGDVLYIIYTIHIDGLVQERCNSSALAMELHLSCINPSIWFLSWRCGCLVTWICNQLIAEPPWLDPYNIVQGGISLTIFHHDSNLIKISFRSEWNHLIQNIVHDTLWHV